MQLLYIIIIRDKSCCVTSYFIEKICCITLKFMFYKGFLTKIQENGNGG